MRTPSHLKEGKKKPGKKCTEKPPTHPELSNKKPLSILATEQVDCPWTQDIFKFYAFLYQKSCIDNHWKRLQEAVLPFANANLLQCRHVWIGKICNTGMSKIHWTAKKKISWVFSAYLIGVLHFGRTFQLITLRKCQKTPIQKWTFHQR